MQILVTGASGFLGSAVLRCLIQGGHRVRALMRPTSDRRNIDGLAVETVTGDLSDPSSFDAALRGCEGLFHVAADYRLWVPDPAAMYRINVTGTVELMRAALRAGIQRIVYTSSVATLGLNADGTPAHEETPVSLADMIGHYKRSKFMAEAEVQKLIQQQALPAVIVHPSTPVGPRDIKPTPTGQMVVDAATGRMPAFVDTGLNIVHVDDVAVGHVLAFEKGRVGRQYILGGENLMLREILTQIARLAHRRPPTVRLPQNLILPVAYAMEAWSRLTGLGPPRVTVDGVRLSKKKMFFSSQRASEELGYTFRPVESAFRDALTWFNTKK
jgi:dihydroflavonol-4-reductase